MVDRKWRGSHVTARFGALVPRRPSRNVTQLPGKEVPLCGQASHAFDVNAFGPYFSWVPSGLPSLRSSKEMAHTDPC